MPNLITEVGGLETDKKWLRNMWTAPYDIRLHYFTLVRIGASVRLLYVKIISRKLGLNNYIIQKIKAITHFYKQYLWTIKLLP